jgi:transcriptional regulator with XRE-family HTH domain
MPSEAILNRGAERLAAFLRERGWSPRKLARHLDCDHSSVIMWKEGRTIPTLHRALDLERTAGVDPHDWLVPVTAANDNGGTTPDVPANDNATTGGR